MEKAKKPIWKKWWFWVLIVIIVGIAASQSGGNSQPTTSNNPQEPQQTAVSNNEQSTKQQEEPVNKPTISKDEFDQIKNGMTYEEVVEIIGSEGEVMSEVGEPGSEYHTIMYSWDGEGMIGANANFTFQNGKLQAKAQFGLE